MPRLAVTFLAPFLTGGLKALHRRQRAASALGLKYPFPTFSQLHLHFSALLGGRPVLTQLHRESSFAFNYLLLSWCLAQLSHLPSPGGSGTSWHWAD